MPKISFPKCIACGSSDDVWFCLGCQKPYCKDCAKYNWQLQMCYHKPYESVHDTQDITMHTPGKQAANTTNYDSPSRVQDLLKQYKDWLDKNGS